MSTLSDTAAPQDTARDSARQSAPEPTLTRPVTARPATTRRALLDLLKRDGAQDAGSLARRLGVSAMAVRQHLYDFQAEGLVEAKAVARGRGRPAKLWHLTDAAARLFPDAHAELPVELLATLRETLGQAELDRLLVARSERQAQSYVRRVPAGLPLAERLAALAALRSGEGYMATIQAEGEGFLLLENHCPICIAARACSGLCATELAVVRAVLGPDAEIERVEHILAGARRCAYRIRPRSETPSDGP